MFLPIKKPARERRAIVQFRIFAKEPPAAWGDDDGGDGRKA
jgi:hypothetical protein